ncbi:MAG: preprotein translocase subunit SecY [Candidatus Sumerlaea chitinivorans]|nr:preprotein translocase subunit SecY [Candidatus Sumerlaea chitinivorans]
MIRSIGALKNIWKIPDLKQKVLYTLLILAVYRIGAHIPTPFIDRGKLTEYLGRLRGTGGGLFEVVDLFGGYAFRNMSIFALGIMPYISMSIILQLMAVVFPRLQKIQQEGVLGQRKINRWTRIGTIFLTAFQAFGLGLYLLQQDLTYMKGSYTGLFLVTTVFAMTTGTAFIMWLGERISDKGIGNGMSLIIAAGIMAHYPTDAAALWAQISTGSLAAIWAPVTIVLFVISSMAIILVQEGTRRIPIQQAKRVVGRRVMAGGTNYLPLKINTAGVIPVIFASAILSFPSFLGSFLSGGAERGGILGSLFSQNSPYNLYNLFSRWFGLEQGGIFLLLKSFNLYIIFFALLTGFFCYFYTAIVFNPDDIANNLKKAGSFIPGKRPGKPTAEYIDYILTRITTAGAVFLVLIAVTPLVLETSFGMPYNAASFVGGTGLIIVIGVMLDTLKQIESQLLMRHYEGFAMRKAASVARWR